MSNRAPSSSGPTYGPYSDWAGVRAFTALSEEAYAQFALDLEGRQGQLKPTEHLFLRMEFQARYTSRALVLNTSWILVTAALALLRVRIEQAAISSYLVHEDPTRGLDPFLLHVPVTDLKLGEAAARTAELREQLGPAIDTRLADMRVAAAAAQQRLDPTFDPESGRFRRQWTELDLASMIRRRDELVQSSGNRLKVSLEPTYEAVYRATSSVVHADCSSLSHRYLDLFSSGVGPPVLMPKPVWALIAVASNASLDIIQAGELGVYLGSTAEDAYYNLFDRWMEARDQFIGSPRASDP